MKNARIRSLPKQIESINSIFNYIDYRIYLKDYYAFKKKHTVYFSYRYFSKNAGINSPNFLKQVIEGKRNLTRPVTEKFLKAMKMNEKEAIYFKNLVFFNQAKTAAEKQEHYVVLKSLAKTVNEKVVGADVYDYFDSWYTCVIRELICQHDFKDDYVRIAGLVFPKIKPKQVEEAIKLLIKLDLITRRADGKFYQVDNAISTGSEVTSLAVRNFNRTMIELAGMALDGVPVEHRHASGITMGIPREGYDVFVAEIYAFKDRLIRIANSFNDCNIVYQMNVQLFPLSKKIDEGKSK
jgi:hypothetical protein, TIGR02147